MKASPCLRTHRNDSRFGALARFCATGATQVLAAVGGLLLAVVIARTGGPEQLGMFTVMLTLLGVLGMIARRGQGSLLTRGVAWALHEKGVCASVSLLLLAIRRIFLSAIVLGLAGSGLLSSGILGSPFPGAVHFLPIMLFLVTALALFAAYARGSARPWLAPVFELGGISCLTVLLLMPSLVRGSHLTSAGVMSGFLLSMLLLALIAGVITRVDHPVKRGMLFPEARLREELSQGQVPFTLIALAGFLIQSGSFLLAAPFLSEAELGLLRGAERLALLVSFCTLVINPMIAPGIVRLSRGGDPNALRRLTSQAMLASTGIAVCVLLPLLIWPERALALLGAEFGTATRYLRIMALAQFAAALLGPLAMILHMTGRERVSMWANLATLAVAAALVPGLSLTHGAFGFALAYAVIIVTRLGLIGGAILLTRPIEPRGSGA
ncbi:MAG: lipopolysaccharide biosynthesis protein [Roseovarius sp.]|uniref:lipopolysaccharide biosynthesis protein n=1 Tax=Roseovarius sp. TaxID=1486281 RepID=UPI0040588BBA